MAQEVVTKHDQLPDHLRQYQKAKIGNIDVTDLVIPRIKLIQAISPELETFDTAKAGSFWHTIATQNMGNELVAVPIVIKKSYILWAPRNDDRGILARAMDAVHWDLPNTEFTVKPKGSPQPVTYNTKGSVAESGLDLFGSGIPGDPQSRPAASLTYNMLWFFPEYPHLSPSVIINTRSSIRPMQQLLSRIDSKPAAHFTQLYTIGTVQEKGAEGPYFNYTYTSSGYADAELCEKTEALYNRYADKAWQATEEEPDVTEEKASNGGKPEKGPPNEAMASKF